MTEQEIVDAIAFANLHILLEIKHKDEEELGLLELFLTEHFPVRNPEK